MKASMKPVMQVENHLTWRRSRTCAGGECLEIAETDTHVYLRRSDATIAGAVLGFTLEEWEVFLEGLEVGFQ